MKKLFSAFFALLIIGNIFSLQVVHASTGLWLTKAEVCDGDITLPSGSDSIGIGNNSDHANVPAMLQIVEFIARYYNLKLDGKNYIQVRNIFTNSTQAVVSSISGINDIDFIIRGYQNIKGINVDGQVGNQTSTKMGIDLGMICGGFIGEKYNLYEYTGGVLKERPDSDFIALINAGYDAEPTELTEDDIQKDIEEDLNEPRFYQKLDGIYYRLLHPDGSPTVNFDIDGNGNGNGNNSSSLYLIPDNPGILDWAKVGGKNAAGEQRKGEAIAKGVMFKILDFLLGFIAILAVIMLTYAGFLYITDGGEGTQKDKATSIITWSSAGLVLVILAESLVNIIFPTQGDIRDIDNQGSNLNTSEAFNTNAAGVDLIVTLLNWILGFLSIVVIIMFIYAGFLYLTAQGESDRQDKATKLITQAVVGVIIILSAFALVNILIKGISAIV